MNTIYNFLKPQTPVTKGLVEMINTYGNEYGALVIDGKVIANIYKSSFPTEVIKRSFIKECVKVSGVSEDKLTFVYVDFEEYARQSFHAVGQDYDSSEFGSYTEIFDLIKKNPNVKLKAHELKVVAVGIDELEEKFY